MSLSVLTLNLWNVAGPYAERAQRIRDWIVRLDPDLISLQEVVRMPDFDQAAELLYGLAYQVDHVMASAFWREGCEDVIGEVGNAVASRWPITAREELPLPHGADGERRAALSVTVDAPAGELGFTSTHLNWKFHHGAIRERQVAAVCDLAWRRRPREGFPPILAGDFNAEPGSAEIRYVAGRQSLEGRSVAFLDAWEVAGAGGEGSTWSNENTYASREFEPDRRIDYVFVGLPRHDGHGQVLRARVVCDDAKDGVWPSDHFGLYAELRSDARARP